MINEYVAPIFTVLGVILGGGVSYFTNTKVKQVEFRQSMIRYELENRRKLYSDFLAEANKLALISIENKSSSPTFLLDISRLLAEIELVGSKDIHKQARRILECIVNAHSKDAKNIEALLLIRAQFVELVKLEFNSIEKKV
ncbi:hypothetical protein [Aeromonas hydrophila]|uniref:hypothetical protein n=1 Tax=Aeromonas hydrophila TaxID=644 RepID=UPI001F4C342C|nr:hypothetical protein [Aeromonas hydrophila]UNB57094.1 hypothetical protein MKW86_15140 [Aeromonas hydrophila]